VPAYLGFIVSTITGEIDDRRPRRRPPPRWTRENLLQGRKIIVAILRIKDFSVLQGAYTFQGEKSGGMIAVVKGEVQRETCSPSPESTWACICEVVFPDFLSYIGIRLLYLNFWAYITPLLVSWSFPPMFAAHMIAELATSQSLIPTCMTARSP
jgi:hypothetical protein